MKFIFNILTFSLYVIFTIEFYTVLLLSTISEIKDFDHSNNFKKFSLISAFVLLCLLLVALTTSFYQYAKAYKNYDKTKQWYLRELFNGLKDSKPSRLFKSLFMVIRI